MRLRGNPARRRIVTIDDPPHFTTFLATCSNVHKDEHKTRASMRYLRSEGCYKCPYLESNSTNMTLRLPDDKGASFGFLLLISLNMQQHPVDSARRAYE